MVEEAREEGLQLSVSLSQLYNGLLKFIDKQGKNALTFAKKMVNELRHNN